MPTNASLTISFVSITAGNHEVCYRIQGSGDPYTCATIFCAGSGASCQYTFNFTVDDEQCDPVTFEYYAKAECETEIPTPLTTIFTPEPSCKRWRQACESVGIDDITLTDGGAGYLTAPTITIDLPTGAGGTQATAVAVINTYGKITTLSVGTAGSGWAPSVTEIGHPLVGGTGTGATADITTDAAGNITSLVLNDGGQDYTIGDTLSPQTGAALGSGTGGQTNVLAVEQGSVIGITITSVGTGYEVVPAVTFQSFTEPGGSTATGTAVLADCAGMGTTGCAGGDATLDPIPLGEIIYTCKETEPITYPTGYSDPAEDGNCLCNCINVTMENTSGAAVSEAYVNYTECGGNVVSLVLNGGGAGPVNRCIVEGSLTYTEGPEAIFSLIEGAPCDAAV